jgi:hypothetical protein
MSADDRAVLAGYQRNQMVYRCLVRGCDSSGTDHGGAAPRRKQYQGCAYDDADKPTIEHARSVRQINHQASPFVTQFSSTAINGGLTRNFDPASHRTVSESDQRYFARLSVPREALMVRAPRRA